MWTTTRGTPANASSITIENLNRRYQQIIISVAKNAHNMSIAILYFDRY